MHIRDLSARHPSWYDHTSKKLGKTLLERLNNSNLTITNLYHESTFFRGVQSQI